MLRCRACGHSIEFSRGERRGPKRRHRKHPHQFLDNLILSAGFNDSKGALLHLQHQLVDFSAFLGESTTISNGNTPSNITRVIVDFAAGVDQEEGTRGGEGSVVCDVMECPAGES